MVELNDEEHELILDNPEAAAFNAEQSIKWAIEQGIDRDLAESMWRPKPPEPALDTDVLNRIAREVTMNLQPAVPDTPKMAELRKELEPEIAQAIKDGLMIDMVPE